MDKKISDSYHNLYDQPQDQVCHKVCLPKNA